MDKFEQIAKLAEAANLIMQVQMAADEEFADDLQDITFALAGIADQIEGL